MQSRKDSLRDRIDAVRLHLFHASKAGNRWSDGRRILQGEELKSFKAGLVNILIELRADLKGVGDSRQPKDMLAWRNFANLRRLTNRSYVRNGKEPLTLEKHLRAEASSGRNDPGGLINKRIALRALRRIISIDPKTQADFAATPDEAFRIENSICAKTWLLRQDVEMRSGPTTIICPKDTILSYSNRNGFHVMWDGVSIQKFDPEMVRKARKRDMVRLGLVVEEDTCPSP